MTKEMIIKNLKELITKESKQLAEVKAKGYMIEMTHTNTIIRNKQSEIVASYSEYDGFVYQILKNLNNLK